MSKQVTNKNISEKKLPKVGFFLTAIILFALPIIALIVANTTENTFNTLIQEGLIAKGYTKGDINIMNICATNVLSDVPVSICLDSGAIILLNLLIYLELTLNIIVLLAFILYRILAFRGRIPLVAMFRIYNPIVATLANVYFLCNAVIIMLSLYFVQTALLGLIFPILTMIIVAFVFIGVFIVVKAQLEFYKDKYQKVDALEVRKADEPKLFELIDATAKKLSSPVPDTVLLGLSPEFYVTESIIAFEQRLIKGKTLYLSLPISRILTKAELEAILAHELSHFTGKDTLYTKKFAPKFTLMSKRTALFLGIKSGHYIFYPLFLASARLQLYFFHLTSNANGKVSRLREFEADKGALRIESANNLASSLVKLSYLSDVNEAMYNSLLLNAEKGKLSPNLSLVFISEFTRLVKRNDSKRLRSVRSANPYDSHPPLDERLKALGVSQTIAVRDAKLIPKTSSASKLIKGGSKIEEKLSKDINASLTIIANREKVLKEAREERLRSK